MAATQTVSLVDEVHRRLARCADEIDAYGIRKLAVFGSAIHGDSTEESDLDLLVEFLPGRTPGLAFFEIQDKLSCLLRMNVDLNTPEFLSRHFRDKVQAEAQVVYERA